MIVIDGSEGEGGGQVLRTSLALSLHTGQPFRIANIRARRKKPGLLRQHLTAVQAACEIGAAAAEGDALGSTELTFLPNRVRAGHTTFSIGTAGSTTLVLQTILLPLMLAGEPSTVTIEGGTHNPAAPPFPFLERAFLPLLRRMGGRVEVELVRPGYYPAGGGKIRARIEPSPRLGRLELLGRGAFIERSEETNARAGVYSIILESEHVTEVFTGFGERPDAEAQHYLDSDAAVGEHLADQLLLPLALGDGGSFTTTFPPSSHTLTNIAAIRRFLDVKIVAEDGRIHVSA